MPVSTKKLKALANLELIVDDDPNAIVQQELDDKAEQAELDLDDDSYLVASRKLTASERQSVVADYNESIQFQMEENLVQFIECFLALNESPSDEQMHCLAKALGLSKERLEEVVYRIAAERLENSDEAVIALDESDLEPIDEDSEEFTNDPIPENAEEEFSLDVATADADQDFANEVSVTSESEDEPSLDMEASIITNPTNTDELMSNDGEPDPYIVERMKNDQRGAG